MRSYGGDDPMKAAIARWEAEKRIEPLINEAALALYEGGDMDDAAEAVAKVGNLSLPMAKRWVESAREFIEVMHEALESLNRDNVRDPEELNRRVAEGLERRGLMPPEDPERGN
jgi:hypothetical protein